MKLLITVFIIFIYAVNSQNQRDNLGFTANLYRQAKPQSNFVISPYSIQLALYMLYKGTSPNSQSAGQLMSYGFNMPNKQSVDYFGQIMKNLPAKVNGIEPGFDPVLKTFAMMVVDEKYNVSKKYRTFFEKYFDGQLKYPVMHVSIAKSADKLTKVVNRLVSIATENMITDILRSDSLTADTSMLLLNAVYLKAQWAGIAFKDAIAKPFRTANGRVRNVPMFNNVVRVPYHENDRAQVIMLPLTEVDDAVRLGMYFVLPRGSMTRGSAINTLANLAQSTYLINHRKFSTMGVNVTIPEFKIDYNEDDLKRKLYAQGIRNVFQRNSANLNSMLSGGPTNLYVQQLRHKARIEVNKNGVKAAAVTSTLIFRSAPANPMKEFKADRPFLFYITARGRHGATPYEIVLFSGQLTEP